MFLTVRAQSDQSNYLQQKRNTFQAFLKTAGLDFAHGMKVNRLINEPQMSNKLSKYGSIMENLAQTGT